MGDVACRLRRQVLQHLPGLGGVGAGRQHRLLRPAHRLALTACRARVTWAMLLTLRMRSRISRAEAIAIDSLAPAQPCQPWLKASIACRRAFSVSGVIIFCSAMSWPISGCEASSYRSSACLPAADMVHRNLVGVAVGAGEESDHLLFESARRVLRLLQDLLQPLATASCAWVALSRSEPNWAKAATSRKAAMSRRSRPATCFIALV